MLQRHLPAAEMGAADAAAPAAEALAATTATRGQQSQPPRLRQFFPETLFWLPELLTDAEGHAQVEVPIADSITTWRISVLASDQDGNLGSAEVGLRVFQDFFVEPDLPRFLTVGDEVAVPVSIFNYLDEPQEITLAVTAADWFDFVDQGQGSGAQMVFTVQPNEVSAAYIPIRVTGFGLHDFEITATGSAMSDAVLKQVEVLPDGLAQATAESGKLAPIQRFTVNVPEAAVPGTAKVTVKVYPGVVSQIIDGLEGMLQQPYGCFEQTSSTTYPNVLVLDYLKTTDQANPRLQLQAEQYITLGYQRLLSFEVGGMPGGFSLFGDPPPQTMLTAYGLMEFTDMSQVSFVDPALIERTANFLFQRQQADGSWQPQGLMDHGDYSALNSSLSATAYVVWALADAGYANSDPVQRGVNSLQMQLTAYLTAQAQTEQSASPLATPELQLDPYVAALVCQRSLPRPPNGPPLRSNNWLINCWQGPRPMITATTPGIVV
ncbi:MAG: alpha-2-macroglobulin family protein [Caldilineaceae bacterium]